MKSIILKPHEAQSLAAGKPVVIWRAIKWPVKSASNGGSHRLYFERDIKHMQRVLHTGLKRPHPHDQFVPFSVGVPLFGKETWCEGEGPIFRAEWDADDRIKGALDGGWKSATTMPERIARVRLTLSDVKVRRPCDVTELEAFNMGFETTPCLICDESGTDPSGEVCADCAGDGWHSSYSNFHALFEKTYQACADSWVLYHFTALATPQTKGSP